MNLLCSSLVFVIFLLLTSSSYGLTVEEAYQAIPHRRMEYSATKSTLASPVKNDLEKFFHLSDQALIGRIETMNGLQQKKAGAFANYQKRIQDILTELQGISNPELVQIIGLLTDAILAQQEYFSNWSNAVSEGKSYNFPGQDASVRKASGVLQQLYSVLMQKFPNEHPNNIDSFYQHLCALDFL